MTARPVKRGRSERSSRAEAERSAARRGRAARAKGRRAEQEAVALCRAAGLQAERAWWLAHADSPEHRRYDVLVMLPDGATVAVQIKRRRAGLALLYQAVESVAFALVRQDGAPWLAVLPAERLLALLARSDAAPAQALQNSAEVLRATLQDGGALTGGSQ